MRTANPPRLPADCVAIPVAAAHQAAPVRLCAVVHREGASGRLMGASTTDEASTCVGAIVDAAGSVLQWLQWRLQRPPAREGDTNADSDVRWERQARELAATCPSGVVWTGWEHRSPLPTWLDLNGTPFVPADPSGDIWRLCRDDALLRSAGLPAYSTSRHRFLYLARRQLAGGFIPISDGAPTNEHTRSRTGIASDRDDIIPFNPTAGLLQALTITGPPATPSDQAVPAALRMMARLDREMREVIKAVRM